MNRDKAIETINDLPEDFDLDILIEKLIFIEKVEKGLSQAANKQTVTHEHVKQKVREWQR
jgi:hypothetical protein